MGVRIATAEKILAQKADKSEVHIRALQVDLEGLGAEFRRSLLRSEGDNIQRIRDAMKKDDGGGFPAPGGGGGDNGGVSGIPGDGVGAGVKSQLRCISCDQRIAPSRQRSPTEQPRIEGGDGRLYLKGEDQEAAKQARRRPASARLRGAERTSMGAARTSLGACNGSAQGRDRRGGEETGARVREKENHGGLGIEVPSVVPVGASEESILERFGIGSIPGTISPPRQARESREGGQPTPSRLAPLPGVVPSVGLGGDGGEASGSQRRAAGELATEMREGGHAVGEAALGVLEYAASGMESEGDSQEGGTPVDLQDMWQPAVAQGVAPGPVNPSPIQLALAQAGNKTQVAKHKQNMRPGSAGPGR